MTNISLLLQAARERCQPGTIGRELLLRMSNESSTTALSMLYDARVDTPADSASRALLDVAIAQVELAVIELAREIEALESRNQSN